MRIKYPPGPRGAPVVGNVLQYRRDNLGFLLDMARTYGDIAHFRVGPLHAYLLSHPDHVHDVLVERAKLLPKDWLQQKIVAPLFGNGMLISNGEDHKRQRRMAQPAFQPRRVEGHFDTFVRHTREGIQGWGAGGELSLDAEMLKITMKNVCRALFNVDSSAIAERAEATLHVLLNLLREDLDRALPLPMWIPTAHNLRKKEAIRVLDEVVMSFVKEWRAKGEDRGDLLSILMREEGGVTHDELRDHLINMFAAGYETTAYSLVWAFSMISRHPEVEARFYDEIDSVLGDRPVTARDLPRLSYTSMIMKETLRLYPPGWHLSPREPTEDIELGGYTIRKGSLLFIAPYVLHRDPRFFPEPEQFRPERFSPSAEQQVPRGAYIPFGLGHRVCIGQGLFVMESMSIMATLAQHYRITLLPGQELIPQTSLALAPPRGVRVKITRRKEALAAA